MKYSYFTEIVAIFFCVFLYALFYIFRPFDLGVPGLYYAIGIGLTFIYLIFSLSRFNIDSTMKVKRSRKWILLCLRGIIALVALRFLEYLPYID